MSLLIFYSSFEYWKGILVLFSITYSDSFLFNFCSSLWNWSIRADALDQSEQNLNLWTSKCQQSAPWPLLQDVNLKGANGPSMLGVNAVMLAVVCKRMQQLITMLEPAVHRGKDTTNKTWKTMCNARALQCLESCTNGCNIVALRLGDHATN